MNSIFETEVTIRPDDIDMNKHLHSSKYQDYLFTARFDQMKNNYKMSMEEFMQKGYSWVVSEFKIEYKRPVTMEDEKVIVQTQIQEIQGTKAVVGYWIRKSKTNKVAAQGYATYTMISMDTARAVKIPDEVIELYSI